ncbi:MAG: zinc ribbon domain-containing protein [Lachnospiraceae bacterium]|nr:zinc ribbon domain-containing protein [Lachnospiraceae bacterium]
MEYRCKVCGSVHSEKPRFCPECGSYFIDAADPFDGKEWRGVIRSDGTLAETGVANVTRKAKSGKLPSSRTGAKGGPHKVWSILSLVSAGIVFFLNVISFISREPIFILGISNFIFWIVIQFKADGWMKKLAAILIILSIVLFIYVAMVML